MTDSQGDPRRHRPLRRPQQPYQTAGHSHAHFWARGYFCATVGQMTEEMIKQYLEHHFEPRPNDDFKMEPPQ